MFAVLAAKFGHDLLCSMSAAVADGYRMESSVEKVMHTQTTPPTKNNLSFIVYNVTGQPPCIQEPCGSIILMCVHL